MTTKQARRARDAGISRAVTHADRAHDGWAAEARAVLEAFVRLRRRPFRVEEVRAVAHLYDPADPAVLRLIRMVVEAAGKAGIDVNVCGEMSGEPLYTPLLLGMGLRSLRATPRKIPEIKRVIRQLSVSEAEKVAGEALRMDTARQVQNLLRDQLRRILPEAVE